MDKHSRTYTFLFAAAVCVVCGLLVSFAAGALRSRREMNQEVDRKRHILKVVGLRQPVAHGAPPEEVTRIFDEKIEEVEVDARGGLVRVGPVRIRPAEEEAYPLFLYKESGQTLAFCFPVSGKGLWSTIEGYMALEADGRTIRGVTFYRHGETPGLGGEVASEEFQDRFKGKKIWDLQTRALRPVAVVKGRVKDTVPTAEQAFYVDGITGATMTGAGITAFLDRWIRVYGPYLIKTGETK